MVNPEQLWQLSCLLYMVMLASFQGDGGAAVFARHALVSAFDLHRCIAKNAVCRRSV